MPGIKAPRLGDLALDRFDLIAAAVIVVLVAVLGGMVLSGDHVGVYVPGGGYGPLGVAGGLEPVRIRFSDAMSQASVASHFHIVPEVPGDLIWTGQDTLLFTPRQPWTAGQIYTVTVERGARAVHRSKGLQAELRWTFTARLPRAVYLAPADEYVRNLVLADLQTGQVEQLTASEEGIEDFAVSPNGSQIAFSQNNPDQTANIWVLDLSDQALRQVTNCLNARCHSPAWKPDGTQLAYQRDDPNASGAGTGIDSSRAWIVDLTSLQTRLLFDDPQFLGAEPAWSPTGQRVAVFDVAESSIRIHDYAAGTDTEIGSLAGIAGHWSPDGQKLVYPMVARGALGSQFYTTLEITDFQAMTRTPIGGPQDAPVDDGEGSWSPDGRQLVVTRRYLDNRFTSGRQIYLLNPDTGAAQPLVVDPAYYQANVSWDSTGQRIIFQRYPLQQDGAHPSVWMYDLVTHDLRQVADNAMLPQWIP